MRVGVGLAIGNWHVSKATALPGHVLWDVPRATPATPRASEEPYDAILVCGRRFFVSRCLRAPTIGRQAGLPARRRATSVSLPGASITPGSPGRAGRAGRIRRRIVTDGACRTHRPGGTCWARASRCAGTTATGPDSGLRPAARGSSTPRSRGSGNASAGQSRATRGNTLAASYVEAADVGHERRDHPAAR